MNSVLLSISDTFSLLDIRAIHRTDYLSNDELMVTLEAVADGNNGKPIGL